MLRACTAQDVRDAIEEYRDYRRGLGSSETERLEKRAVGGMIYALRMVLARMEQATLH